MLHLHSLLHLPQMRLKTASQQPLLRRNSYLQHATQTPLTSLHLSLDLALQGCERRESSSKLKHWLTQAKTSTTYLQALLQPEATTHWREFNLFTAAEQVITVLRVTYPNSSINLSGDQQAHLKSHQILFQETLSCLITNAIQASSQQDPIALSILTNQRQAVVQLSDLGKGMSWFEQKLAFYPGFSSKTQHSGLGLAFAKHTVEQDLKGKLFITSHTDLGTTITMSLPLDR